MQEAQFSIENIISVAGTGEQLSFALVSNKPANLLTGIKRILHDTRQKDRIEFTRENFFLYHDKKYTYVILTFTDTMCWDFLSEEFFPEGCILASPLVKDWGQTFPWAFVSFEEMITELTYIVHPELREKGIKKHEKGEDHHHEQTKTKKPPPLPIAVYKAPDPPGLIRLVPEVSYVLDPSDYFYCSDFNYVIANTIIKAMKLVAESNNNIPLRVFKLAENPLGEWDLSKPEQT